MHIVGPFDRFPLRETRTFQPGEALLADYIRMAAAAGIDRMIVVQPSNFGMDNNCTLAAVRATGGNARAVVVVPPGTDRKELRRLHTAGARGVRVQVYAKGGLGLDAIEPLARDISDLGWHLQLYCDASSLPEIESRLRACPVDIVLDHMAHIEQDADLESEGFKTLLRLLDEGRTWVKLSNALFQPSARRARRLAEANPDRVLWASDWPHIAFRSETPDDGLLVDAVFDWFGDDAIRAKVLIDNPSRLYFS